MGLVTSRCEPTVLGRGSGGGTWTSWRCSDDRVGSSTAGSEVGADQWALDTPCTEWNVRTLVNHVTVEDLWVPPLLRGATIEEIGDRFDGDQLGDDPKAAWRTAHDEAVRAVGGLPSVESPYTSPSATSPRVSTSPS